MTRIPVFCWGGCVVVGVWTSAPEEGSVQRKESGVRTASYMATSHHGSVWRLSLSWSCYERCQRWSQTLWLGDDRDRVWRMTMEVVTVIIAGGVLVSDTTSRVAVGPGK